MPRGWRASALSVLAPPEARHVPRAKIVLGGERIVRAAAQRDVFLRAGASARKGTPNRVKPKANVSLGVARCWDAGVRSGLGAGARLPAPG
jgi:hypothetical protein